MQAELTEKNADLKNEKQDLENQLEQIKDPEYRKHLVHQELGFIESDEWVVKFPTTKP